MTKLQSKTWRQWDAHNWHNFKSGATLSLDSEIATDGTGFRVYLYAQSNYLIRNLANKQQALAFIKEFIADE